MHEERVQALQQYLSELKELPVGHDKIKKVCVAIEEELGVHEKKTTVSNQGITIQFNVGDDLPAVYIDGKRVKYMADLKVDWKTRTENPGKFSFLLTHWEDRLFKSYEFER